MIALEGDCKTPLGAYGERDGERIHLRAFVAEPDGARLVRADERAAWPESDADAEAFGRAVGAKLRGGA
jgi:hydroxymethylbilane synthase